MRLLKDLFHFLGGIHFAIALILTAALTVIAGTLLESKTGSHLLAARWTYEHLFFQLLLAFFFINILFSALRRWPFRKKHIPFLITHLGLLMIISGTIVKNRFGLQGQMSVWEGSGSQQVMLPQTYALHLEGKDPSSTGTQASLVTLSSFKPGTYFPYHFPDLKFKIIGYAPHVKEKPEAWIKEEKAYLSGIPPIAVATWEPSSPFPEGSIHLKAYGSTFQPFKIIALRTGDLQEALRQAYLQGLILRIQMKEGKGTPLEVPLQEALLASLAYGEGFLSTTLYLSDHNEEACLQFHWSHQKGHDQDNFSVPLQGAEALLVKSDPSGLRNGRFVADLIRPHPTLCFVEEPDNKTTLFAFDQYGRVHAEVFTPADLKSIVSYDQGFGGYSVQAVIPIPSFSTSREDKEKAAVLEFTTQLKEALAASPPLSPPLQFLEAACRIANVDFVETFAQFLFEWHDTPGIRFAPERPLPAALSLALLRLDWKAETRNDLQAVLWTNRLLEQIEPEIQKGETLQQILEKNRWPFLPAFKEQLNSPHENSPLNELAGQLFNLIPYLPELELSPDRSDKEQASLLSSFFRIYGIDHRLLLPERKGMKEEFDPLEGYWKGQMPLEDFKPERAIVLETPLTHRIIPDDPPLKLEDRRPGIVLEVQQGQEKQTVALAYDPHGAGMKWPLLNGRFLARFQPAVKELPYRIRLRQARQILYPQSAQVYSYESDVLVAENEKPAAPQTLSMNHVYETWDGYRFYLSGVGSSADGSLKRIQLAVNHDPAKYYLTYPGAFLVFTGIVLLFWILPYRKSDAKRK